MKVFRCTQCGFEMERPTQPFKCQSCGRQGLALFKAVSDAQVVAAPSPPPPIPQSVQPVQRPAAPPTPVAPVRTPPPAKQNREEPAIPRKQEVVAAKAPRQENPVAAVIRPARVVWAYPEQATADAQTTPMCCAPAMDAAHRVFLHARGRLVALEERNRQQNVLWEYATGSHAPGPVVLGNDGNLRVHCGDGNLHCVTLEGKQAWPSVSVGQPLGYAAPLVDERGNTLISACEGGLLRVAQDGRLQTPRRYFRSRQKLNAPGVVFNGILYIGGEDGHVFAIQLGEEKGVNVWNHAAGGGRTGWYIHSRPIVLDDGVIVVAGRDECIHAFAPDGSPLWKTSVPGQMLASPTIDRNGHIYAGVGQWQREQEPRGLLVCLDANSHKIRWEYQATGPVESTPVVGESGMIYFGDNSGVIHAVDSSGRAAWICRLHAPVRSTGVILGHNRVAFGLDDESLVVFDGSTSSST